MFPDPSVTVQVTVVAPSGNVAGALLVTDATEQLSAVVGVPRATPVASQVAFAKAFTGAAQEIVGFWLSDTVTVYEQVDVFPSPSIAVHITLVVPKLKVTLFNVVPVPIVAPDNA